MKKYLKHHLSLLALLFVLLACNNQTAKVEETKEKEANKETSFTGNKEMLVSKTDSIRAEIEKMAKTIQPVEISTKNLRAQISQKWSKIHYYSMDGKVIRIKTYPYDQISKRTEEFYFSNGSLVLACIEDDGSKEMEKEDNAIDKMYYFDNDMFVIEKHLTTEPENEIRNSDSERLLEEAKEYLEILKNK